MTNNTTMSYCKAPPELSDESLYEQYKEELEIWKLLKVCPKEEEGPLIFRTLPPKAKSAVIRLGAEVIGSVNGLDRILARLDALYLSDTNQRIFQALDAFEKYKRPPNMLMPSFLLEFEKFHDKVAQFNCKYPDGVLAYRLLKAANISNYHEQLIKATVATGAWTSAAVRDQLMKVFSEVYNSQPSPLPIKVEPVFQANVNQKNTPNYDYKRSQYEFQPNPFYDSVYEDYEIENEKNEFPCENDEYDVYYGAPSYEKRPNQTKWRRPERSFQFQQPRGYQKYTKFIDDPTIRAGLRSSYNSSKNVPNPKDSRGNFTTCRHCRSIYHWVEDCPHVSSDKSKESNNTFYSNSAEEQIYIGLFQSNLRISSDEITCLLGETLGMAVIDSGCPKTVCGQEWLDENLKSRNIDSSNLQWLKSDAIFRFGDSEPVHANKKVLLPLNIANKDILLETEVVSSNIPLLLSKETMKTANAKMYFENDKINLFGVDQTMICTSTGHYAIPIKRANIYAQSDKSTHESNEALQILFTLKDDANVKNIAKKLHQQFSHPRTDRLIKFIKTAGVENEQLVDALKEVGNQCETCKRYKRKNPKPVVSLPLSYIFNDTVAMDLKIFKNNEIYFLHIIDHSTRFSAGSVIRSKNKEVIVDEFFKKWVAIFGAPRRILSDNRDLFKCARV